MTSKCSLVSCAVCSSSIKVTEQYLICIKCKNNIHSVCTALSFKQLEKIDQKNWLCSLCVSPGNVDNGFNILEMLYLIRIEQKSLYERITLSEEETNKTKDRISELTEQFEVAIRANGILSEKVAEYENKITILESRDTEANEYDVIAEMFDRQNRAKNILVFNLTDYGNHVSDVNIIQSMMSTMGLDIIPIKVKRLGGRSSDNLSRPIKAVLPEHTDVFLVLKNKKKLHDHPIYNSLRISPDKTIKQREHYKELLEEVNEKKSKGERDIFIRYVRGNAVIVEGSNNVR